MSTRDLLRANNARFYALAAEFSAEEWSQPSLCDGWSNHDVLAHLVVGYCSETTSPTSSTCFSRSAVSRRSLPIFSSRC